LDEGHVVRALRLSGHPPDPTARFSAELATRLRDAAGAALSPATPSDKWLALLQVVVESPVRRTVRPEGLPPNPSVDLLETARQHCGRVPALAPLLGLSVPPPPGPVHSNVAGKTPLRRPPRPPRPPRPAGRPAQAATTASETTASETTASETTASETTASETTASETTASETTASETTASETTASETEITAQGPMTGGTDGTPGSGAAASTEEPPAPEGLPLGTFAGEDPTSPPPAGAESPAASEVGTGVG
jgi:hypothetical protein